jgi:hypothetical protein
MRRASWLHALQAMTARLHTNVSEAVVLVTGLVLACNAAETIVDHLNRGSEGGGDRSRHSHGEPG